MRLARFALLLFLLSSGIAFQILLTVPEAKARTPVTGSLFIDGINYDRLPDFWDNIPTPLNAWVYFKVTYHGLLDTGTPPWSGCRISGVYASPQSISTQCEDHPQFDFDALPSDHSIAIDFAVYKHNSISWLLGEKVIFGPRTYTFPPGTTPEITLGDPNSIQFNVRTQIAPPTNNVIIYAEPHQLQGQEPYPGNDLHATVGVSYTLNEVEKSRTDTTPFNVQADVGSLLTLGIENPPSNWKFACSWDNYGHGSWSSCTLTYSQVFAGPPDVKIAAFFDYQPPCPDGQNWTGSQCACPAGQNWNGQQCIQCSDGQIWDGSQCTCPAGEEWNGQQCVQKPQPPSNGCGGTQIVSIEGGGIAVFSIMPQTETTNVWVYAFPFQFLGQDPATQIPTKYDVGALISVTYCQNGNSKSEADRTPFSLSADQGTPITLFVLSPPGFACVWDHYGYAQAQTCTLSIDVTHDDKIVAYFNSQPLMIMPIFDTLQIQLLDNSAPIRDESTLKIRV